jgi:hypothetical protein
MRLRRRMMVADSSKPTVSVFDLSEAKGESYLCGYGLLSFTGVQAILMASSSPCGPLRLVDGHQVMVPEAWVSDAPELRFLT